MSGAEAPAGDTGPEPPGPAATARAYLEVFADIADGRNRTAALTLRGLSPDALAELIVICGDVATMTAAEQRARGGPEESRR